MSSTGESSAFDRYLDALLAGDVVSPEEFARREGVDEDRVGDVFGNLFEIVRGRSLEETVCLAPVEGELGRERVGGFRLLRRLGKGGMGEVFLAEQEELGRLVALKVLPAASALSPTAIERFRREARAAARLRHPNIVRLLEVGESEGMRFIAMDFVPGKSLSEDEFHLTTSFAGSPRYAAPEQLGAHG